MARKIRIDPSVATSGASEGSKQLKFAPLIRGMLMRTQTLPFIGKGEILFLPTLKAEHKLRFWL